MLHPLQRPHDRIPEKHLGSEEVHRNNSLRFVCRFSAISGATPSQTWIRTPPTDTKRRIGLAKYACNWPAFITGPHSVRPLPTGHPSLPKRGAVA